MAGLAAGLALAAALGGAWWWWNESRELSSPGPATRLSGVATAPSNAALPAARDADRVQAGEPSWSMPWDQAWSQLSGSLAGVDTRPPRRGECPDQAQAPLRCRRARGSADQLRGLGRPVIVQLSSTQDQFAVVQFTETAAQALSQGQAVWLDHRQIEGLWSGLYIDLFMVPGYVEEVLREGDRGPGVLWVKQAASRAEPPFQADPNDPYFGPALRLWAQSFQATHGLPTDGLIGLATLQRIASHDQPSP